MSNLVYSDSFTVFVLLVLGFAVSLLTVQLQTYESRILFNDKSAILLHPRTRENKNFAFQRQNDAQKIQDAQVTLLLLYSNCPRILLNLAL